jgi:hypothetical protein
MIFQLIELVPSELKPAVVVIVKKVHRKHLIPASDVFDCRGIETRQHIVVGKYDAPLFPFGCQILSHCDDTFEIFGLSEAITVHKQPATRVPGYRPLLEINHRL